MGKSRLLSLLIYLLLKLISLPPLVVSISYCNGPCARETTPSLQSGGCEQSGTLTCEGCEQSNSDPLCENGKPYATYECSPTVTSSTPAKLTNNDFSKGGDGGDPPSCGEKYLSNEEPIVALSTGWFIKGGLCNKMIRIQASNDRSVDAKVVDECDSMHGCDKEHDGQQPCRNNIVDGSNAVWDALGLDTELGEFDITWSMA